MRREARLESFREGEAKATSCLARRDEDEKVRQRHRPRGSRARLARKTVNDLGEEKAVGIEEGAHERGAISGEQ